MNVKKEYTNGEIKVVWRARHCTHVGICFKELPNVFKPSEKPWINLEGASTKDIIRVVHQCPTKALEVFDMDDNLIPKPKTENMPTKIEVLRNGPLIVHGKAQIKNYNGEIIEKDYISSFCRCGASAKKPFCDGAHIKIDYKD